jgi:hypothetical protein
MMPFFEFKLKIKKIHILFITPVSYATCSACTAMLVAELLGAKFQDNSNKVIVRSFKSMSIILIILLWYSHKA